MPKGAKVLKDLLSHKEKLEKAASSVKLSEECSAIIQRRLPQKEGDPRSFTLPYLIGPLAVKNALADLGASINLMPHSLFRRLGIYKLNPTRMSIQLADRSIKYSIGVCENLLVKTKSYEGVSSEMRRYKSFDNVTAAHQEGIMVLPQQQGKSSKSGSTGQISFAMHVDWSELAMPVNEPATSPQGMKYLKIAIDYVSKWVEAQAFPASDAQNVVNFLKRLFARFGIPKDLISDTGTTPFRIIYGKACHLPVELEHKAYSTIKNCNVDLTKAGENRFLYINELDEIRLDAYESSISYKERTKRWHDKRIKTPTKYEKGDKLYDEDGNEFIVNKQRVKPYQKDVLDADKDDDITLEDEGEVT
ncbi:reverse transcriptase domain-containing protein [Tanacetum coccineum]